MSARTDIAHPERPLISSYWGGVPTRRSEVPQVLRTDKRAEFCWRAMLTWAHTHGVALRLVRPGTLTQNAHIESFTGRLPDECLSEH